MTEQEAAVLRSLAQAVKQNDRVTGQCLEAVVEHLVLLALPAPDQAPQEEGANS